MTTTLTPADLDRAATRTLPTITDGERQAFDRITAGYSRSLVTKSADQLVREALANIPRSGPPTTVRLPAKALRHLPDWANKRPTDITLGPDVQLWATAAILREWGWQAKPHKLKDWRGHRCICGALVTTVALGIGIPETAHLAAGHILAELRRRSWPRLIGDWNQAPGRTKEQAIELVETAATRAA